MDLHRRNAFVDVDHVNHHCDRVVVVLYRTNRIVYMIDSRVVKHHHEYVVVVLDFVLVLYMRCVAAVVVVGYVVHHVTEQLDDFHIQNVMSKLMHLILMIL